MSVLNSTDLDYLNTLGVLSKNKLNLLRLNLTGELGGRHLYVSEGGGSRNNPIIYPSIPFFQSVSKSPIALLQSEDTAMLVPGSMTAVSDFTAVHGEAILPDVSVATGVDLKRKVGKFSTSNAKINVDGHLDLSGIAFPLDGANGGWPMVLRTNLRTSSSSYGQYTMLDENVLDPIGDTITHAILGIVAEVDSIDNLNRSMPIYATTSSPTIIKSPAIAGYRRLIITDGSSNQMVVWLKGAGKDILWASVGQGNGSGGVSVTYDYQVINVITPPKAKLPGTTFDAYFPISMPTGLVDNISGSAVVVEAGIEYVGDCSITVFDCDMTVSRASGHISPETVVNYWTTGWGIYKPISEDAAYDKLVSWNTALQDGAYYTIQASDCSGRSLTELTYYKDYAKARRKACKDNDYMSKKFNEEYTMQQVEDMLQAVSTRSVWVSGQALTSAASMAASQQSVTVTDNGDKRIKAVANSNTTYYQQTEEGLDQFASDFIGFKIVDTAGILEKVAGLDSTGEGLAKLNESLSGASNLKYSLSSSNIVLGFAPTYEELLARSSGVDAEISFLVAQLTTFRKFNTFVMGWMNEFNYDNVSVKLSALGLLNKLNTETV